MVGADVTHVLKETCLSNIGAGPFDEHNNVIRVRSSEVSGIQISFGIYGVVALRVFGGGGPAFANMSWIFLVIVGVVIFNVVKSIIRIVKTSMR